MTRDFFGRLPVSRQAAIVSATALDAVILVGVSTVVWVLARYAISFDNINLVQCMAGVFIAWLVMESSQSRMKARSRAIGRASMKQEMDTARENE